MPSFITLTYLIETPGEPERLAEKIASDQSTGTFVALPGETEELKNRVAARVGDDGAPDRVREPGPRGPLDEGGAWDADTQVHEDCGWTEVRLTLTGPWDWGEALMADLSGL